MSSVYQHSRGKTPYWIGVYSDETGKQRHRSTKTTDEPAAIACVDRWQRVADKLRNKRVHDGEDRTKNAPLVLESLVAATQRAMEGSFTEMDARMTLNHILQATGQRPLSLVSAREFLLNWLESKVLSKAKGTSLRYRNTVETFLESLGKSADSHLASVTPQQIQSFRDQQLKAGKSHGTANMVVKTLRVCFNAARRQGILTTNPAEAIDLLPTDSSERENFTEAQIISLLQKADREWRGLILVAVTTGLRLGDASRLKWEEVDMERGVIRYVERKKKAKNAGRKRESIILPELKEYLLELIGSKKHAPDSAIFPKLSQTGISGATGLSGTFMQLITAAGVEQKTIFRATKGGKGRNFHALTFHSLKHTFISIMANKNVEKELRKKIVGHTSNVHDRYTHIEIETLKTALEVIPRFLPPK